MMPEKIDSRIPQIEKEVTALETKQALSKRVLDRQTVIISLSDRLEVIRTFNVRSMSLFGSVARNEATPDSDLDFLVEFEGAATLDGYMDLKYFLEDLFECSVDLVTRKTLKPTISKRVLEEAIRVA